MKINEFAKKYGVNTRSIDYWTSLGLLHPKVMKANGYRDYTTENEEEIKLIIIALTMNENKPLKEMVDAIKNLPKIYYDKIIVDQIKTEMERLTKLHKAALQYVDEIKRG